MSRTDAGREEKKLRKQEMTRQRSRGRRAEVLVRMVRPGGWRGDSGSGVLELKLGPGGGSFHHRIQNCESGKPRDPCQTRMMPCFNVPCALSVSTEPAVVGF